MIKTIKNSVSSEITVKKSKFIANVFYIESEKEAQEIIKQTIKKYHDAKHNCYAYIVKEIDNKYVNTYEKSSDNGEPSGTAGAPLLDVLKKQNISNALIIVTRYFGGILLGTGGLVKAYTESATDAIKKTELIEKEIGNEYEFEIPYEELKNFQYNCNLLKVNILNIDYQENIKISVESTKDNFEKIKQCNICLVSYKMTKNNKWISLVY